MKRPGGYIARLWLCLCVILLIACGVLWIRSLDLHSDSIIRWSITSDHLQRRTAITTLNGILFVGTITYGQQDRYPSFVGWSLELGDRGWSNGLFFFGETWPNGVHGPEWAPFAIAARRLQPKRFDEINSVHTGALPLWSLILLFAIAPARSIFIAVRRHRRIRNHRCPHCGYDLRFSTDRCPECGQLNPTPPSASSPPPAGS